MFMRAILVSHHNTLGAISLHSCGRERQRARDVRRSRWRRPVECSCFKSGAWRLYRRVAQGPRQTGQEAGKVTSESPSPHGPS
ncbi:hypothetical protein MHYP_G00209970 [Metynnis hypsauchen]